MEVWNLTKKQQEELAQQDKEGVQTNQEKQLEFNTNELYIRILKVERLAEKVKEFTTPKEMENIMSEINQINQTLQKRRSTSSQSQYKQ